MPSATLVTGLWQADQATLADERLHAAVGADHYVTTLRDAVNACVVAAVAARQADAEMAPAEPTVREPIPS